jgi:hypothetical protein
MSGLGQGSTGYKIRISVSFLKLFGLADFTHRLKQKIQPE